MMLNCWSDDPDDRLPFNKLSTKLGKLLETASVSTLYGFIVFIRTLDQVNFNLNLKDNW